MALLGPRRAGSTLVTRWISACSFGRRRCRQLLLLRNGRKIGFEFKYSDAPRATKSMHSAVESLQLEKLTVIHPGEACYELTDRIQVRSLATALKELEAS